MIFGIEFQF
jgi:hypothetical protein